MAKCLIEKGKMALSTDSCCPYYYYYFELKN